MKKSVAIGTCAALLIVVVVLLWHHEKSSADALIRQRLTGKWIMDGQGIKGTATFRSDGSYGVNEVFDTGTNELPVKYEGKWQVIDGYITFSPTQAVSGGFRADAFARVKVVHIDDQELAYTMADGTIVTRKKSK